MADKDWADRAAERIAPHLKQWPHGLDDEDIERARKLREDVAFVIRHEHDKDAPNATD